MEKISPYARVSEVAVADVKWRNGFWAGRIEACHTTMIPSMWKILDDSSLSHAYANFRIAAGLEEGKHSGPPFFDGDLYKWLESVSRHLRADPRRGAGQAHWTGSSPS